MFGSFVSWGLEFIGGYLIAAMQGIICAIIYWCISWTWPWLVAAMAFIPSWFATDFIAKLLDGSATFWRVANVFLPIQEYLPWLFGYWTVLLGFKTFAIANSLRKV